MSLYDVTGLGEVMLRLSVPAGSHLETARQLDVHPGGAEANTLVALARIGYRTAWCSGLPLGATGRLVANHLRQAGVDLSCVVWSDEGRTGLYFLEHAEPPRNVDVIYDRADSCASRLRPDQVDWDRLMDTSIFHISGITPAVSPSCLEVTRTALAEARARGVMVSFDLNFRSKMWTAAEARAILQPMLSLADILFCGQADAETVLGLQGAPEAQLEALADLAGGDTVVMSCGMEATYVRHAGTVFRQGVVPVQVVDRLGAGDALAAGVLHGLLNQDVEMGLRFGSVMAAMTLTQHGDMLVTHRAEVEQLVASGGGALQR